MIDVCEYQAGI